MSRILGLAFGAWVIGAGLVMAEQTIGSVRVYGVASVFIEVQPYGEAPEFHLKRYEDFKAGGDFRPVYFAAYARSPLGYVGVAQDFNRLEDAQDVAVERCQRRMDPSAVADAACEVVGVLVPEGFEPTDKMTMGHGARAGFLRYRERSGAKAFAIGSRENWASHHSAGSIERAKDRAIANCTWVGGNPNDRAYGGDACVIVEAAE